MPMCCGHLGNHRKKTPLRSQSTTEWACIHWGSIGFALLEKKSFLYFHIGHIWTILLSYENILSIIYY